MEDLEGKLDSMVLCVSQKHYHICRTAIVYVYMKATVTAYTCIFYQRFFGHDHCPISTATTHIGSSCACSGGKSSFFFFYLVLVTALSQSKAVQDSHPETYHTTVSRSRHCDDVIHSTNGHLVLSSRLLSLSTIQAIDL